MTTKPIGLYVHVPFCLKKCNYCDFCSFDNLGDDKREEYLQRLIKEICGYKKEERIVIDTVFFGGGTPSLLTARQFSKITDAIKDTFLLKEDIEFTIEANPKTLTKEKLLAYIGNGVNRLSIGLQSKSASELGTLGRVHDYNDFLSSYTMARECGIKNISVDIMYALPGQTLGSIEDTLNSVIALTPEHISAYSLILEEGTPLFKIKDTLDLIDEEKEFEMYTLIYKTLAKNGYNHYEISNYAKRGFECKHNLKYWQDKEFIGVGLAAYSYFDGKRYGNTRDLHEYLTSYELKPCDVEIIDKEQRRTEFIMLSLRLSEGIDLALYKRLFDADLLKDRAEVIDRLVSLGYLKCDNGRLYLTDIGFYLSNSIIAELI